jgi:hypothetical protein
MTDFPLLIEFTAGTSLFREPVLTRSLPMVHNGPPGTFVIFRNGRRVPLPTDQIVHADDAFGAARVAFGGMRFDGMEDGVLVFRRDRDLLPPEQLSPERGRRMTLEPELVAAVHAHGQVAWSAAGRDARSAG